MFNDLSTIVNNRRHALIIATLYKMEIVRVFIAKELSTVPRTRTGVLHWEYSAFFNLVERVSEEVTRVQNESD